ncbi:MAG: DUF4956 domain-containing protein [Eubacteriales bacterium]
MLLNSLFTGIFDTSTETTIVIENFLLCILVSIIVGIFIAVLYTFKTRYTKSFVITLATLPAVVAMIIMMVNGNIGAGVAVAGTFSLVRFRSVPGTAKEIGAIFLAMGAGLALGMGYVGFAIVFVVLISVVNLLLTISGFGEGKATEKTLIITMPENLDYTNIFEDLFEIYTKRAELNKVKTTNMGSLLKLTYDIDLRESKNEKNFLDEIRCRNGNLEIVLAKQTTLGLEL